MLALEEFEISWGWPLSKTVELSTTAEDSSIVAAMDKTVTHAVIEYLEGEDLKKVTVLTSPYFFRG